MLASEGLINKRLASEGKMYIADQSGVLTLIRLLLG